MIYEFLFIIKASLAILTIAFLFLAIMIIKTRKQLSQRLKQRQTFAFFHPSCNAGGGGEKVLFCMLKALENLDLDIIIYSGEPDQIDIFKLAKDRFNLNINQYKIQTIYVHDKSILAPKKQFTILYQILGMIYFSYKALNIYPCDYFFDSQGYAFSYVIVKLLLPNCKIGAYVHYPFVSQDMIKAVENNQSTINYSQNSKSRFYIKLKTYYYKIIVFLYKITGDYVDIIFTNSTWTNNHMTQTWKSNTNLLYPPCNVSDFLNLPIKDRKNIIVSFAQIRPEKNHQSQLSIFKILKDQYQTDYKLKILGSVRDKDDQLLLDNLKQIQLDLGLQNDVEFVINQPYSKIKEIFGQAKIGIHTMQLEHFGISIVEMMAAGLIVVAHDSAGPQFDIIQNSEQRGFLCNTNQNYIDVLKYLINIDKEMIIENARSHVDSFSDQQFIDKFRDQIELNFLDKNKFL